LKSSLEVPSVVGDPTVSAVAFATTPTMKPKMSDREIELLNCAAEGKRFAVEFGVGGSTSCLIDAGVEKIFSVESDPVWIERVVENPQLLPHVVSGRLTVHHGDIGPTRKWGHPEDRSRMEDWPRYWRDPWMQIDAESVDLVVVDGRFRVACALNAVLQGNRDQTIVVHDFWNRPKYEVLLQYLNCACRVDTLAVFFVKARIDADAVERDLEHYARQTA
jgi:hypothetical protein